MAADPAVGPVGEGPAAGDRWHPSLAQAPRGRRLVRERGRDLIAQPLLNKGTAFSESERDAFGLRGLLPARVLAIEEQVQLELEHVRRKTDDLERYIGLAALQEQNETLFYRVLSDNLEELMPIVYTPTVGLACQEFSHILRRPRGIWLTPDDIDRMESILVSAAPREVRLIVVTDNERILGLGDQGAGGMAIPVGKLALYTAGAGIHPSWTLPVSLDVGTDRADLLEDPLYLGHRAPRLRGAAYDEVVEAFVEAVGRAFPRAIVQWEDFKQHNALAILGRYRHRLPSFNDDVQGTAAVVLAGLLAARRGEGLGGDRVLILGAGAAAIGVATLLRRHLAELERTTGSPSRSDGTPAIALMDRNGLLHAGRQGVAADQAPFAVDASWAAGLNEAALHDPVAVARAMRATVLIGATGFQGAFTEPLVRAVAQHASRPVVLPLSNPTSRAEADPRDVLAWTDGRAIVATGSPSAVVSRAGSAVTVGQANNAFVFPGLGLGAIVAQAREIPEEAFLVAAAALAARVTTERLATGGIYPPVGELRAASRAVAIAVVRCLRDGGFGRQYTDDQIEPAVDQAMWAPEYPALEPAS